MPEPGPGKRLAGLGVPLYDQRQMNYPDTACTFRLAGQFSVRSA